MGMGSASFWVQSILLDRSKLPTQKDFIQNDETRLRLGPLVWNAKKRAFIDRRNNGKHYLILFEMLTLSTGNKCVWNTATASLH